MSHSFLPPDTAKKEVPFPATASSFTFCPGIAAAAFRKSTSRFLSCFGQPPTPQTQLISHLPTTTRIPPAVGLQFIFGTGNTTSSSALSFPCSSGELSMDRASTRASTIQISCPTIILTVTEIYLKYF